MCTTRGRGYSAACRLQRLTAVVVARAPIRTSSRKMIIPVSIDKAAQAEAQGAGGAGGNDEKAKTKGVCVPEWSMVELQGELVSKDPMSGQPLGSMTSENVRRTAVCLEVHRT